MIVKELKERGSLISGEEGHQFRSGYVILAKGEEVGEHSTTGGEELLLILEGKAEVRSGSQTSVVVAQAMVLIPTFTVHNVRNVGETELRYVYMVSTVGAPNQK
jgi:quercetin dioxygenase-like cupin family protein